MKFQPYARETGLQFPKIARAALVRRQRLEREKHPLFADEIAQAQPDIDEVMEGRPALKRANLAARRHERARAWRNARARLFALPDEERQTFRHWWNTDWNGPKAPEYLLDILWQLTERDKRPWEYSFAMPAL